MTPSLVSLLTENITMCSCFCILKVLKTVNRTDVFNRIRALPNVVIVDPVTSAMVGKHNTKKVAYSLVELKYISDTNPFDDLESIRRTILSGNQLMPPVEGVVGVIIQKKTLKPLDS